MVFRALYYKKLKGKHDKDESSLQFQFNQYLKVLKEQNIFNIDNISETTTVNWFNELFFNTKLYSNPTDYCSTAIYTIKKSLL